MTKLKEHPVVPKNNLVKNRFHSLKPSSHPIKCKTLTHFDSFKNNK